MCTSVLLQALCHLPQQETENVVSVSSTVKVQYLLHTEYVSPVDFPSVDFPGLLFLFQFDLLVLSFTFGNQAAAAATWLFVTGVTRDS